MTLSPRHSDERAHRRLIVNEISRLTRLLEHQNLTVTDAQYTVDQYDYIFADDDAAGALMTITLPPADLSVGRPIWVKKTGTTASVQVRSLDLIDGALEVILNTQNEWVNVASDGATWRAFESGDAVFVAAGYGGIRRGSPAPLADFGAGYVLLSADAASVGNPRGVIQDFANDGLIFIFPGIWSISINFSLLHNDVNSGRSFNAQLWNATANTQVSSTPVAVGRNQGGTNYSIQVLTELSPIVGDLVQIRIGGGDAFSNVELQGYSLSTNHVGLINSGL